MQQTRKDFFIPFLTVAGDAAALEGAFLFSYWLRFYSPLIGVFPPELGIPELRAYVNGSLLVIPAWLLLFKTRGMYRSRRNASFSDELFAIIRIVFFGMLLVMAAAFFYREFSFSRLVFGFIAASAVFFVSITRFGAFKFEQWWYAKGRDIKHVILVGTNESARRVYQTISNHRSLGYDILGYFSSDGKGAMEFTGARYLGAINGVPGFVRDNRIDVVLVALTSREHPLLFELVRDCEGLNTEIMMVPDLIELMTSNVRIRELEGIPFLQVKEVALTTWDRITKRSFDLVFAAVVLVVALPFFLVISLFIKLTSSGPVFYLQERVGLDGRKFRVMKFRTMNEDAEKASGPVWAVKNDPRTTSIGKILRRFSMDELPQLLNVLRGEMSIVGPRPERPHFVEQFKEQIPKYLDRHRVKTGMTGWAQVNGLRGSAPIEERTKLDVYYVENWSLAFDLKIILKTLRAVLFGTDAY